MPFQRRLLSLFATIHTQELAICIWDTLSHFSTQCIESPCTADIKFRSYVFCTFCMIKVHWSRFCLVECLNCGWSILRGGLLLRGASSLHYQSIWGWKMRNHIWHTWAYLSLMMSLIIWEWCDHRLIIKEEPAVKSQSRILHCWNSAIYQTW